MTQDKITTTQSECDHRPKTSNEAAHQRGEAAAPELIATAVLTASGPVTYDRALADFLKGRK